ncbi:Wzz/FepE/Etk N-terminal domain-containing protein [Candidatus Methylomirabilis sp.]|uniref:GumC family protein n=1 Tax=Candidatus Methylomirabilis sp. TaxID=2032687 RepID=UPI002A5D5DE8|nr:Wzz/FepE/Etk N-terminal domain-containing protein [Candidatus Methylomirabilis sp.]
MPEADEVELIDYLNTLWKWKFLIVVGTLAAVVIAFAVSVRAPITYEATAILLITESKVPRPEAGAGAPQSVVSPEVFEATIKSQALALQAIQQFGLDKKPFSVTPTEFLNDVVSVKPRRGTNLLTLTAVLPDPKLAADVVNFVAQKAVELNANLNQIDTVSTKEYIQQQRDKADQTMETAQAALVEFKRTANLESLQTEQRILLAEKEKLAQRYSDLTFKLKSLQSQVAALKQALTKQEQLITVTKSIFSDPAMLAATQDRGPMDVKTLSSIQVKDQAINEVYQMLQSNLIAQEANLASAESERQDTVQKISDNEAKLISISRKIADADARLEELDRTYRLTRASYELFAKRFDEASLSVASRVTELKLIAPAGLPTVPRSRNVIRNGVLAGTVALMTCIILAFSLENLQETKRRRVKIVSPAPS